jgi:hypothetical protein
VFYADWRCCGVIAALIAPPPYLYNIPKVDNNDLVRNWYQFLFFFFFLRFNHACISGQRPIHLLHIFLLFIYSVWSAKGLSSYGLSFFQCLIYSRIDLIFKYVFSARRGLFDKLFPFMWRGLFYHHRRFLKYKKYIQQRGILYTAKVNFDREISVETVNVRCAYIYIYGFYRFAWRLKGRGRRVAQRNLK